MKIFKHLYAQVLLAIALGVAFGFAFPETATRMEPMAALFVKLIKMLIAPIIFCTVVTGVMHMGDMRSAGRLGLKALVYFEAMTTLALILGLAIGNLTGIGKGMGIDPASLDASAVASFAAQASEAKSHGGFMDFFLDIVPQSFFSGVVNGNVLQTLFVAILFAWAALGMGKAGHRVAGGIDTLSHVFYRAIGVIMRLAPLGAFGAMAFTVGKYGIASLVNLFGFVALFYASCICFVLLILGAALKLTTGLSIFALIRYFRAELIVVLGTSSSETALPRLLEKLQRLGCAREVVGMVVPTGYSFNLDGTSMYFTLALLFLSHAIGVDLTASQQLSMLGVLLFASKGAAGVVGSAFVVLAGTLSTSNVIPVAAVSIVLGVDRFMSEARALTNLVGNCVATLIVARWENALDLAVAKKILANGGGETCGETDPTCVAFSSGDRYVLSEGEGEMRPNDDPS
ncbi:MAG: C4-dicarboxylate transporter DctA [Rickettsiales bacterium]